MKLLSLFVGVLLSVTSYATESSVPEICQSEKISQTPEADGDKCALIANALQADLQRQVNAKLISYDEMEARSSQIQAIYSVSNAYYLQAGIQKGKEVGVSQ